MRSFVKARKSELLFLLSMLYITSKMLWDQIPLIFEIFFVVEVGYYAFIFVNSSIRNRRNGTLILIIIILWFYILANALLQDSLIQVVRALYEYVFYMLCTFAAITIRRKINIIVCMKSLSVWGLIITILTWGEYISKHYILKDLSGSGKILYVGNYGFRAAVFSRSFLSHGVVLGIFFLVGIYIWYITKQRFWLFNGIFAYISILATGSRGPLVAFTCAIIIWVWADAFFVKNKRDEKKKFIFCTLILGIIVIIFFSMDTELPNSQFSYFIYRIKNIANWKGDAGNVGRILIWKNSINDWFCSSPIIGIGASKTGSWGELSMGVTESGILKRLCELGIVGFLLNYGLIAYIIGKLFEKSKDAVIVQKKELVFWFALFIGIFINDLILQSTEEIMVAFWYWLSLGMIYYIKNDKKNLQPA